MIFWLIANLTLAYMPYGEREIYRGDAGIAAYDSLGSVVEAPSILSFINDGISASGSSVYNMDFKLGTGIDSLEISTSSQFQTKPNFVGAKFSHENHGLAAYIFSKINVKFPMNTEIPLGNITSRSKSDIDVNMLAGGISYSYLLNSNNSIGFNIIYNLDQSTSINFTDSLNLPTTGYVSYFKVNSSNQMIESRVSYSGNWDKHQWTFAYRLPPLYSKSKNIFENHQYDYSSTGNSFTPSILNYENEKVYSSLQGPTLGYSLIEELFHWHIDMGFIFGNQSSSLSYERMWLVATGADFVLNDSWTMHTGFSYKDFIVETKDPNRYYSVGLTQQKTKYATGFGVFFWDSPAIKAYGLNFSTSLY